MLTSMLYSISLQDFDIDKKKTKRAIEDSLKDFSFSYWSVPSTVPADVVRMAGQTKHGHSFLQISPKNIQLTINFDENYNKDMSMCISYANAKLKDLTTTLNSLGAISSSCGVVTQYVYDDIDDPVSRLKNKIFSIDTGASRLHNLEVRFAVVYKDMYYVNVDLSVLSNIEQKKQALGVKIDINNKYMLEQENENSNVNDIFKLVAIQERIGQANVLKLLDEGRFELN